MQGIAGVPELAKGDRLRTCWRRPTRVRIPAPALVLVLIFISRGGVGGYPTGLWIPRLGFESRPRPYLHPIPIKFNWLFLFNNSKKSF